MLSTLALALLAASGVSAKGPRRAFQRAVCEDINFKISTSANNVLFNLTVTDALDLITRGDVPVGGTLDLFGVEGTFNLFGKLCGPASQTPSTVIQVLSHAAFEYSKEFYTDYKPESYNYVDIAANKGLYTFAFDRLGHGQSDRPADGLLTVQSALHIEIWNEITKGLRDGSIGGKKWTHVIGVGHSYAGSMWNGVITKYPGAVDAVGYLGYSHELINPLFVARLLPLPAAVIRPLQWLDVPVSYLGAPKIGRRAAFYYLPGSYEQGSLDADESNAGVFTLGEFLTLTLNQQPAETFTGDVAYFNGENDGAFCPEVCGGTGPGSVLAKEEKYYPAARSFHIATFPDTGHGVINHLSAPALINAVQDWVISLNL